VDALERPTIEFLVVDDENVELAQKRSLPSGAKGGPECRQTAPAVQASRFRDR
jgi:hypothetical protein